eukprot:PhM_4_TR7806/c0_g1_i1/m.69718/K00569/TPMT, tpmT; thiopurine S-methyltransferase
MSSLAECGAQVYWTEKWAHKETGWRGAEHGKGENFAYNLFRHFCEGARSVAAEIGVKGQVVAATEQTERRRARVLVPLCGDTPALDYFATQWASDLSLDVSGVDVVGVDLAAESLRIVRERFPEGAFVSTERALGDGTVIVHRMASHPSGGTLTLYEGDFFGVMSDILKPAIERGDEAPVDLVYDRASFMAILPSLRPAYVEAVLGVLRPADAAALPGSGVIEVATILLEIITREDKTVGPPFDIPAECVTEEHYTPSRGFGVGKHALETNEAQKLVFATTPMPGKFQTYVLFRCNDALSKKKE